MNIIFFSVAAVSSIASLITAIYGIYFKDGGTRPGASSKTAEVSRFAESGGTGAQARTGKLRATMARNG